MEQSLPKTVTPTSAIEIPITAPSTVTTQICPTGDTPENPISPEPHDTSPSDPRALGLSNARSWALQTIFLNEDIPNFLTTFNIPLPPTLPDRLDIPRGVSYPSWLLRMVRDPHEGIPPRIIGTPVVMPPEAIYNDQEPDKCFKGLIHTIRLKPRGTYPKTAYAIRRYLLSIGLQPDGLIYRGTSRHEARCAFQDFKPAPIECTDLGDGLYTSASVELALGYSGPKGVVWVFKYQSCDTLEKGTLDDGWADIASGIYKVGGSYDVIYGWISEDRGAAGMQGCDDERKGLRVQVLEGGWVWVCWRTRKAWELLARGLVAMIFLDTGDA